jgi:hypothetical protein
MEYIEKIVRCKPLLMNFFLYPYEEYFFPSGLEDQNNKFNLTHWFRFSVKSNIPASSILRVYAS